MPFWNVRPLVTVPVIGALQAGTIFTVPPLLLELLPALLTVPVTTTVGARRRMPPPAPAPPLPPVPPRAPWA
jgi:hypothetical protein